MARAVVRAIVRSGNNLEKTRAGALDGRGAISVYVSDFPRLERTRQSRSARSEGRTSARLPPVTSGGDWLDGAIPAHPPITWAASSFDSGLSPPTTDPATP